MEQGGYSKESLIQSINSVRKQLTDINERMDKWQGFLSNDRAGIRTASKSRQEKIIAIIQNMAEQVNENAVKKGNGNLGLLSTDLRLKGLILTKTGESWGRKRIESVFESLALEYPRLWSCRLSPDNKTRVLIPVNESQPLPEGEAKEIDKILNAK